MSDDRERTRDRLEAARLLSDRGWGRPVQAVDLDVAASVLVLEPDFFTTLTGPELDVLIDLLERGFLTVGSKAD